MIRKSFNYQYSDDSTFQPEQRARLPHLFANRESVEVAEGSVQQAWCEQRARYLLPTEPEKVSATRKAHITAHIRLSRGPDYPTFTRIEAVSISEKVRIRKARPPVQYRKIPTAGQTQLGPTHQYTSMLAPMTDQKKGVLDKRDFRKSFNYHYSNDSTFQPEQRASLPHLFANRESAEVAEGSVQPVSYTHLTLPTKA